MVIMGSRGRTGLARLFLGSVAEKVIRLSHCSVLVARDASATASQ
jgi:nucleotide-binding universal stress UspA family protein